MLTVAHRLHTVMDSDRIVIMDAGNVVEFDVPHVLLQKPHGVLTQMVEATGGEADALRQLASKSFQEMMQPGGMKRTEDRQLLMLLERTAGILVDSQVPS